MVLRFLVADSRDGLVESGYIRVPRGEYCYYAPSLTNRDGILSGGREPCDLLMLTTSV